MVYVNAARKAGATAVLCTSVSRAHFAGSENNFLLYTHGEYPAAVRALCAKEGIPLIDLKMQTRALLISLGPEAARSLFVNIKPGENPKYPDGIADKTHFSLAGAQAAARMVAEALRGQSLLAPEEVNL